MKANIKSMCSMIFVGLIVLYVQAFLWRLVFSGPLPATLSSPAEPRISWEQQTSDSTQRAQTAQPDRARVQHAPKRRGSPRAQLSQSPCVEQKVKD